MFGIVRKLGKFHEQFLIDCHESIGFNARAEFDLGPGPPPVSPAAAPTSPAAAPPPCSEAENNDDEFEIDEAKSISPVVTSPVLIPASVTCIPSRKPNCSGFIESEKPKEGNRLRVIRKL